jgi:hypothetical protein
MWDLWQKVTLRRDYFGCSLSIIIPFMLHSLICRLELVLWPKYQGTPSYPTPKIQNIPRWPSYRYVATWTVVNDGVQSIWRDEIVAYFQVCANIMLEELKETIRNRSLRRNFNPWPPKYEVEDTTTQTICSVRMTLDSCCSAYKSNLRNNHYISLLFAFGETVYGYLIILSRNILWFIDDLQDLSHVIINNAGTS